MILAMIVAIDENNGIGKNGDQLAYISNDLKRFKALTTAHTIIMGRKTFESIGTPLQKRVNVVISKSHYQTEGIKAANNLMHAFNLCDYEKRTFVIGGGEIYKEAIPYASKIYATKIDFSFPNIDTYFPAINQKEWLLESEIKMNEEGYHYAFLEYSRKTNLKPFILH